MIENLKSQYENHDGIHAMIVNGKQSICIPATALVIRIINRVLDKLEEVLDKL